ncbi:MAG: 30S ribosomal protein S16 [Actinomycetota bacterium]
MVKIRLMRMGARKRPFYRVVVADSRSPRDGRFIENIGKYHPLEHPSVIDIDQERALHWLRNGAQPTQPARVLLEKTGVWASFTGQAPPETAPAAEESAPGEAEAEQPSADSEPNDTKTAQPEEAGEGT